MASMFGIRSSKMKKGAAGATKIGKLSKPPKQGKAGPISTPFSNRVAKSFGKR